MTTPLRTLDGLHVRLSAHPLHSELHDLLALRVFAEHHVFAVWDFMSLLKALQREVAGVQLPWRPQRDARLVRLIHEIVLAEESDLGPDGRPRSHFELYLEAMGELGADRAPIGKLLDGLESGQGWTVALARCGAPIAAQRFVECTMNFVDSGKAHVVAAAFTHGREEPIPGMFRALVDAIAEREPERVELLRYYLERHIEIDGEEHGALAHELLRELCARDPIKEREALWAAEQALEARLTLWDGIVAAIRARRASTAAQD
jgi:molybdopterin-guanine dinucleotide biosynthesis protein A